MSHTRQCLAFHARCYALVCQGIVRTLMAMLIPCALLIVPAQAEDAGLQPVPFASVIDQFGMNMTTGYWQQAGPTVSIGPTGQGGLSYTWMWGQNIRNPFTGTVKHHYFDSSKREVTVLGKTEIFESNGSGGWTASENTGGSLTESSGNYTYTDKYGTVSQLSAWTPSCGVYCTLAIVSSTTFPNGLVYSYTWRMSPGFELSSLTTNLGYQIKFNFASDNPGDGAAYTRIVKIMAINNAVEYCNPSPSVGCSPSSAQSLTISRSGTSSSGSTTVTDPLGENWVSSHSVTTLGDYFNVSETLTDPTSRSVTHTYSLYMFGTEFSGQTASVGGNTWTYNIDPTNESTVTDPNGVVRGVGTNINTGEPYYDVLDPAGLAVSSGYSWAGGGKLATETGSNGNFTEVDYSDDGRGNIVEGTQTGTGNPLSTTFTYAANCTYQKTCNKPASMTDANGNTTNYTYDNGHGGVLTVLGPEVGGVRSLTTTTYSGFTAWYYTGPSTISQGSTVYLPTGTATCTNANSCSGNAAERVTALTYQSGNSGTGSNLLNMTATVKAGDNSVVVTTTYTYDGSGNVTSVQDPRGNTTVFFYDAFRRQVGVVRPTPGGGLAYPATKTTYDDAGRVLAVEQGTTAGQSSGDFASFTSLIQAEMAYDSVTGAKISDVGKIGGVTQSVTQYSYDAGGRPTCTAKRRNTSSLPSDACDQSSGSLDLISQNNYDAANRVTSITTGVDTGSPITALTNGYATYSTQIVSVKDGKNNLSTFTYNSTTNRLEKIEFPSKTTPNTSDAGDYETYTYDNQGNMTAKRLRSGETVAVTYDERNRVSTKSLPSGANSVTVYAYNQVNNMLSMRYGNASGSGAIYTWDALGRKLTEGSYNAATSVTRTISSEYDVGGNRTCLKYPDNQYIQYTYDVLGRMKQVQERGSSACNSGSPTVLAEYSYDNLGRVTLIDRYNGADSTACYGTSCFSGSAQSWRLSQDLASSGQDVNFDMDYTAAEQLSDRGISNSSYRYGNAANTTTNYCANGLNQYGTVGGASGTCSGGQTYAYDNRGNLTSDGSRTFTYDMENKLIQSTGPGSSGTPTNWNAANWNAFQWSGAPTTYLGYDPLGRLLQTDSPSGTQQYLYDGTSLIVEYDAGGTILRRYVPGADVDESLVWYEGSNLATRNWLHTDQQGSVVAASNSSGVSAAIYAYGPFGEPSGGFASGGPIFRYTGQAQLPGLGLYYYKARMYDPMLGRFLQTDPLGYDAGLNLYAYVMNDPMNNIDPYGMQPDTLEPETIRSTATRVGVCTGGGQAAWTDPFCYDWSDMAARWNGFNADRAGQIRDAVAASPPPKPARDCWYGGTSSALEKFDIAAEAAGFSARGAQKNFRAPLKALAGKAGVVLAAGSITADYNAMRQGYLSGTKFGVNTIVTFVAFTGPLGLTFAIGYSAVDYYFPDAIEGAISSVTGRPPKSCSAFTSMQ